MEAAIVRSKCKVNRLLGLALFGASERLRPEATARASPNLGAFRGFACSFNPAAVSQLMLRSIPSIKIKRISKSALAFFGAYRAALGP